jgi:hypothetical protein
LFARYRRLGAFTADFKQTKELKLEGLTLKASGTLSVAMGRAVLWQIREPAPLAVFVDGRKLRIESGAGATAAVAVYDLKAAGYSEKIAESMRELTSLLSLDYDKVNESYQIAADGGVVTLTPRKQHQFSKVRIVVKDGRTIARIEIDELSGDRLLLDFAAPKPTDTRWVDSWTARG